MKPHLIALTTLTAAALCGGATTAAHAQAAPSGVHHASTSAKGHDGMSPNATSVHPAAVASNEQSAYNYFVGKGLTPAQSAGVVGNLIQESGVSPTAVQSGGPGRGIAQWSVGGRWDHDANDNLKWYAAKHGVAMLSLASQLDFTWYELTTFPSNGLSSLRGAASIDAAVSAFQSKFEKCGDCQHDRRVKYATDVYNTYAARTTFAVSASSPPSNIKALQYLLTAYGLPSAADGSYGPGTTAAVKKFQARSGLASSGSADTATMGKLTGGGNVRVTVGWKNPNTVKAAQQLLVKNGYSARVDGTFDSPDAALITSFQGKYKIPTSGAVDAATWKKLFVPAS